MFPLSKFFGVPELFYFVVVASFSIINVMRFNIEIYFAE